LHFEGTSTTKAPIGKVFAFLLTPTEISECLPNLQTLDVKGEDSYDVIVKVGIGPIKGNFKLHMKVTEKIEPKHARLKVQGSENRGSMDLDATMDLESVDGGTVLRWQAETRLGGLMATLGQHLVTGTAEKMVNEFFNCIRQRLET
jgi:carbon monoxide dehydrogenase subunit G